MATPIKQVPILTGELAEAFVREAEQNEKLPRYQISSEDEEWVKRIARQLYEFKFPWDKK
ncbi:MAG: hypothetical protein NC102_11060 [Clostridium sp.]|nr:hypothetical protein [Clostridium sp.]